MGEIRALVVDDEPLARRGIGQLLREHQEIVIVGEARNGREAVHAIVTLAPDLVFLDVQMPVLDAFGVLREIGPERMPVVIFVTAYDEFAVRAFEAHALDYLVKPVTQARFDAALARARKRMAMANTLAAAQRMAALLASHDHEGASRAAQELIAGTPPRARLLRRIVVPTASGDLVLDAREVEWIEAEDYYAAVHARGRRHLIRESLASLAGRLDPAEFVRAHRSAIVRLDFVRELRSPARGECVLVLRDGTRVPVSRRRKEEVSRRLRRGV
jgi:two-component system, LytTR family, response regulator